MNKQFETANITYKGLEDKGLTVTLLDENGKKWTIWKKGYQTDEDSEPYAALHAFTFGDTFGVSYQEKDESFIGKDGKQVNFKRKTIYQIMPTLEQPTAEMKTFKSTQNAPQSTQTDTKVTYQKEGQDAFGRRLAIHGMVNAILSSGIKPDQIDEQVIGVVIHLEDRINKALELDGISKDVPF